LEEVELVTGAPKNELVNDFVQALAEKDVKRGLKAVSKAAEDNLDMKIFLKLILQKVRFILLIRLKAGLDKEIESEVRKEDFEFLQKLSGASGVNINSNTLYELLDTHDKIGRSYIPQLPLELVLVKLSQEKQA
jgi:DNA polymerase III gamma/tau subunit